MFAVSCLALSGVVVFGSIPETRREAAATRDLQSEVAGLQVLLSGEANDERGYLMTNDSQFLAEFDDKAAQIDVLVVSIIRDAPRSVADAIRSGMPAYLSFVADHRRVTDLVRSGDHPDAVALALGDGRQQRKSAQAAIATAADLVVSAAARESASEAALTSLTGGALIVAGLGLLVVAVEVARRVRKQQRLTRALQESEEHFRTLVDNVPAAVYAIDREGVVSAWNPAASAMFGWSEEEVVGEVVPFGAPDLSAELSDPMSADVTGQSSIGIETTRHRRDGTTVDVAVSTAEVRDSTGQVVGLIRIENQRRTDRHLAAIVAASADAIVSTTVDGMVMSWNSGAEKMFGYSAAEMIGRPVSRLGRPQDRADERARIERVLAGHAIVGVEVTRVGKAGVELPIAMTVSPVLQGEHRVVGMSIIARDITDQKMLEEALTRRALHDELTGLPNRALFVDRIGLALARMVRHPGVLAVFFVDIDQFKVINDSLGHEQGDRLLVMVAEALTRSVRPGDTVARFGGDEFGVLCESLGTDDDAVATGLRIQDIFSAPFVLDGRDHHVTVSIGIAATSSPDATAANLLRDADSAMYEAKDSGRSRSVLFAHSMRTRALLRLDTELSLRAAIADGGLRVHYQPIVNLITGLTDGVEALVRWQHPTKGLIPPLDFIPVAEETGLIVALGEWVLGEACRQAHEWHISDPGFADLTVAVNLSARQLTQDDLVHSISSILAQTRLDPATLVLEITESVLMRDATATLTTLTGLKSLGLRLSIDDFGTGYSSLAYLKKFPVDILKIDKSFVDGLGADNDDSAIVKATITMAHSLGLSTIGEGIESKAQATRLTELGCDQGQGFFFCRPQTAQTITRRLIAERHRRAPLPRGQDALTHR